MTRYEQQVYDTIIRQLPRIADSLEQIAKNNSIESDSVERVLSAEDILSTIKTITDDYKEEVLDANPSMFSKKFDERLTDQLNSLNIRPDAIDFNESIESMAKRGEEIKSKVKKHYVLEYVDVQGDNGARYTDIIRYMYEKETGLTYTYENRGWYSAYFNDGGMWNQTRKAGWINPTKSHPDNYLIKHYNKNGELRYFTKNYITKSKTL
tara:strand:+ start:386 stop:1012 length:627 start_codon:yes stop_codon:yes gene_type:complete